MQSTPVSTQSRLTKYPEGFHRQFKQHQLLLVNMVFETLRTDYGSSFIGKFRADDDHINPLPSAYEWKCSLLEKIAGFSNNSIADAVDNCCKASPAYPPNPVQIWQEAKRLDLEVSLAKRNELMLSEMKEQPNQAGQERIMAASKAALIERGRRVPLCVSDPEAFDRLRVELASMVKPFSIAAQRMARASCSNSQFSDLDYKRQKESRWSTA